MTDRASGVVAFLKRAVREPLVHFLAIGLALFVVNGLIRGPDAGETGETVVLSQGRVNQIAESFLLLSGRAPTREELLSVVDDFVSEEVGYREAVAMGPFGFAAAALVAAGHCLSSKASHANSFGGV